jgi:DNA-binding winged helix-turn-helix (wHTH) protein
MMNLMGNKLYVIAPGYGIKNGTVERLIETLKRHTLKLIARVELYDSAKNGGKESSYVNLLERRALKMHNNRLHRMIKTVPNIQLREFRYNMKAIN